jgi:hypothetical protein
MNSNRPIPARGLTDSAWSNGQMAGAGPCQRCGVGATTRGGCRGLVDDSFLARSSPKALGLREESVGQDKRVRSHCVGLMMTGWRKRLRAVAFDGGEWLVVHGGDLRYSYRSRGRRGGGGSEGGHHIGQKRASVELIVMQGWHRWWLPIWRLQ